MRRGCISLGEVRCDDCRRVIPYLERYLCVEEEGDAGDKEAKTMRFCSNCSLKKGYASYRIEKGDRIFTFFEQKSG